MHVRTGLNYTLSALQKDEMHFSSTLHTRYMNKYSNYSERATINHKKIFNKDLIFYMTNKVIFKEIEIIEIISKMFLPPKKIA